MEEKFQGNLVNLWSEFKDKIKKPERQDKFEGVSRNVQGILFLDGTFLKLKFKDCFFRGEILILCQLFTSIKSLPLSIHYLVYY